MSLCSDRDRFFMGALNLFEDGNGEVSLHNAAAKRKCQRHSLVPSLAARPQLERLLPKAVDD